MSRMMAAMLGASALIPGATAQTPAPVSAAGADYFITPVVEHRVTSLPAGRPLYWRIETLPTAAQAKALESDHALPASIAGKHWLFTLAARGGATPGGSKVAEIGPIPLPTARTYLLRINHAGGPPGSQTSVHTHPGSEAIYVLDGQVTQRTRHGLETAKAGEILNAHEAEMAMQLRSSGTETLHQLVMFVVDADRPFSPPARF